jgi:hypothetical protein
MNEEKPPAVQPAEPIKPDVEEKVSQNPLELSEDQISQLSGGVRRPSFDDYQLEEDQSRS